MKSLVQLLFFYSFLSLGQQSVDSILSVNQGILNATVNNLIIKSIDSVIASNKPNFFSDKDLKIIDSLLIKEKFNSSLFNDLQYVMNDTDFPEVISTNLSEEVLKERLNSLNEKTPFNLTYNTTLKKEIEKYLKYRKKYYPALMAKAEYYFPMFEQYLDQFDIPIEMKYLSIVESALKSRARSYVGATGLWQFMYGTGKEFNLIINSYIDERQDPVKSTIAACKYLSQLNKIFGDWDLALAAYNSGPGNVSKAIKRSGGHKDYWHIRPFLPRETANYVPAFYATMYIFEYAKKHNLYPENSKIFHFETDTVRVKSTISFKHISQKIGIDYEILSFLNPKYKLDIIPFVKGVNHALRLPKIKIIDFLNKEKEIYELAKRSKNKNKKRPSRSSAVMNKRIFYRVKSGDYLQRIATKFGVSIRDIKRWNGLRNNKLKIGQRLSIFPKQSIQKSALNENKELKKLISKDEIVFAQEEFSVKFLHRKKSLVSEQKMMKWNGFWYYDKPKLVMKG